VIMSAHVHALVLKKTTKGGLENTTYPEKSTAF
jgi:hypothetical protein